MAISEEGATRLIKNADMLYQKFIEAGYSHETAKTWVAAAIQGGTI